MLTLIANALYPLCYRNCRKLDQLVLVSDYAQTKNAGGEKVTRREGVEQSTGRLFCAGRQENTVQTPCLWLV